MQGRIALFAAALVLGTPAAAAAQSSFDNPASNETRQQFTPGNVQRQDTPNDPNYDRAEPDHPGGPTSTNLYDERYDLFGFPSALTPQALYVTGPNSGKPQVSGFNAAGAWKLTRGRPEVAIAILDTGIKWNRTALRNKIRLNRAELPLPQRANGTTGGYDLDGNGSFNVDDYANDARVNKNAGANGVANKVDAQDLLATFSGGDDSDGNGYRDDIAGWDFFDDDNDPYDASSYFAASNHGSGRAEEAAAETDEGEGEPGVCPKCQLMPIRIWDTFVSDANSFALGMVYATDNGVSVIEGANGSLYHSAFAEAASQYAYEHGVAQVFSGDDLNTGNHNYPANYDHTMLIQGVATDTQGLGTDAPPGLKDLLIGAGIPLGTQVPPLTYFRGAGTTQYGGHSSISMEGATGSENTGKAAGGAGIVVSAGLEHNPPIHLRPDETRAIMEQTAEDVLPENTAGAGSPDQAQVGWDTHFGWGRANLGDAVALAKSGKIPGEASIGSPDWYEPLAGDTVRVEGLARARFASGGKFKWKLEWGPGIAPTTWSTVGEGESSGEVTDFGALPMNAIREAVKNYTPPADPGMPTFRAGQNPYQSQFTVRLTVDGDGIDVNGVDRKVLTALDDPTLVAGFPKKMGTGGEAPIQNADVDGDNEDELIVPLEDGTVHVYGKDGEELPGWPVRTQPMHPATGHASSPGLTAIGLPREPTRGVVVADLDDDGEVELITTAGAHIYAWEPDGSLRDGFPVSIDKDNCRPQDNRQPLVHRKCGFLASPAVARLRGREKPFSIVVPGLDGHVYALDGDGKAMPGFPAELVDPSVPANERMLAESINNVAISDLNGDGNEDIVAASNEVYGAQPPSFESISGGLAKALADLLAGVTDTSTRVYVVNGATGKYLPGWPIKLNGGIQNTLPLIGPGHDPAILRVGNQDRIVVSSTGGDLAEFNALGQRERTIEQSTFGPASTAADKSGALNLFESASIGDVLGSGRPAVVKYQTTLAAAANLLLVGQNFPWEHMIGAFDAETGASLPAWPAVTEDYQFLSSSTIAKIVPGDSNQVIAGTGLGLLHAYDGRTGLDVEGFPKVTGGWMFAPAAIARDGRVSAITREGFLFRWKADPVKCQTEWPTFRHDQQHSGHYGRDGTPPGAASKLAIGGGRLTWEAPGDNGLCGTATRYDVARSDQPITAQSFDSATQTSGEPEPVQGRSPQSMGMPDGSRYYAVRAVDDVGNVGPVAVVDATAPGADGGRGNSSGGSGGGAGGSGGAGGGVGGIGSGLGGTVPRGEGESCAATAGFESLAARARGRGLAIDFSARSVVNADVLRISDLRKPIGARRVAHFTNRRASFAWSGRGSGVGDGYYELKLQTRGAAGVLDTRRIALRRSHGRFRVLGLSFDRGGCGLVALARLSRPVFGGPSNRAVGVTVRLSKAGPVTVEVRRRGKLVKTLRSSRSAASHSLKLAARGLQRGDYALTVKAGQEQTTLTARRL